MIKPSEKQKAFMDFKEEEIKYEFNVYCRELNKDLTNLMECLRKQDKDNKAILYLGKNFKKVILPYEEYQKMCQRLEIFKNKDVDMYLLRRCETVEEYNARFTIEEYQRLTEEEFNTLKEILENDK